MTIFERALLNPLQNIPYSLEPWFAPHKHIRPEKITRFPNLKEHQKYLKMAASTFCSLMWRLAISQRYASRPFANYYGEAKKAYLWLTAISTWDVFLYDGNKLKLQDYWRVVQQIQTQHKAHCKSGLAWTAFTSPPAPTFPDTPTNHGVLAGGVVDFYIYSAQNT